MPQVISRLQNVPDLAPLTPVVGSVLYVSAYSGGTATWSYADPDTLIDLSGVTPSTRLISTTAPLSGGGDLSANRTLAISAATVDTPGAMPASDKMKLEEATDDNIFSTLMMRNAFGVTTLTELIEGYTTVAALQIALDALPVVDGLVRGINQAVGGSLTLSRGVIVSSTPIYISSGQTVRGQGVAATVFDYTGSGFAIRIITQGGHGYVAEVAIEDMTIRSAAHGIGINTPTYLGSPTATGEVNAVHCRRLVMDCDGVPLDFSHGQIVYYIDLDSILITGWKDQILKLGGGGGQGAWGFLMRNVRVNTDNSREVIATISGGAWDTVQAGGASSITFPAGASAVDDFYVGLDVYVFNTQERREIIAYDGTTKVATVAHPWTVLPVITNLYRLIRVTSLPGIEIIDSHGSIRDCSIDIRNRGAACIKFTDSQVHWTGGHFEPQNDQQVSGRYVIELINSEVTHDFPQYLLPNNTWRVDATSRLVLANIVPTDNAGTPLAFADWDTVFSVAVGGRVTVNSIDVVDGISAATPRILGSTVAGWPTWLSTVPTAVLGSGTANGTTYLRGDGTWQTISTGVAGSDTQVIFNDGGAYGGDGGLTYNKTTDTLTATNLAGGGAAITGVALLAIANVFTTTQSIRGAASTNGLLRIYDGANDAYATIAGSDDELLFGGVSAFSFDGTVLATNLSGNGSGITALNAANVASGQLNTARLPDNINVNGSLIAAYNVAPDGNAFIVATSGALTSQVLSGVNYFSRIQTNTTGIGFFGVTPVARPGSTAEMKGALAGLGLLTDGGATDLNLDGGVFSGGSISVSGSVVGSNVIETVGITIDGGGSVPSTGVKGRRQIDVAGTIQSWSIFSDQTGSAVVDVKKSTYANVGSATSIAASAKPTLSSALKNTDATLTGWTIDVTAGDVLEFNLDSASTVTRVTVQLKIKRL